MGNLKDKKNNKSTDHSSKNPKDTHNTISAKDSVKTKKSLESTSESEVGTSDELDELDEASELDDSELDEDDEIDVDGVSSGSEDGEASEDSENDDDSEDSDDDIPKKKKHKSNDGSESFANAFNNIVNSKLKLKDRSAPIMARNKTVLKKMESDKLEAKAKKAILAEKKQLYDKHRVKNLLPSAEDDSVRDKLEHEKKLKKVAQKGVVRLFNAIMSTQIKTNEAIKKEHGGEAKKQELLNEMSKEKFLDLVLAATE